MQKTPFKETDDVLLVDEFNNTLSQECQNVVSGTGQSFNPSDNTQFAQGVARTVSSVFGYIDSGSANNYILTPRSFWNATNYIEGMAVAFLAQNTNTGPSTLNINNLGAVEIVTVERDLLSGGEIVADLNSHLIYIDGQFVIIEENATDITLTTNLANQTSPNEGSRLVGNTNATVFNSLVRAYGYVSQSGGIYTLENSFNVTSVSKIGVGNPQITFTDAMSTTDYIVTTNVVTENAGSSQYSAASFNKTVNDFELSIATPSVTADRAFSFAVKEFR